MLTRWKGKDGPGLLAKQAFYDWQSLEQRRRRRALSQCFSLAGFDGGILEQAKRLTRPFIRVDETKVMRRRPGLSILNRHASIRERPCCEQRFVKAIKLILVNLWFGGAARNHLTRCLLCQTRESFIPETKNRIAVSTSDLAAQS